MTDSQKKNIIDLEHRRKEAKRKAKEAAKARFSKGPSGPKPRFIFYVQFFLLLAMLAWIVESC